ARRQAVYTGIFQWQNGQLQETINVMNQIHKILLKETHND
ncbi:hypothetical protein RCH97_09270, partial [Staphylococcus aureus]|nr:hypothetical protein [Staphylococcus aureus]